MWRGKLRAFHNRILAVPHRVPYLSARQRVVLTQELRDCLTELVNTDPELSSVAEILIAMKKLPDAELLDLLAAVEKEAEKRNLR